MEEEKPTEEWASYNRRNVLGGLYQIEDHARVLLGKGREEDAQCIAKHLAFISSELGELTSHIDDSEKSEEYAKLRLEVDKLYDNLEDLPADEIIKREREIRGKFEDLAGINVKECGACGPIKKSLEEISSELGEELNKIKKNLNKEGNYNNTEMVRFRKVIPYVGGAFVGRGIEEVANRFLTGSTWGFSNSTLAGLGIGAGLTFAPLFVRMGKYEDLMIMAGSYLLADSVIDIATKYIGGGAKTRAVKVTKAAPTKTAAGEKEAIIAGVEGAGRREIAE